MKINAGSARKADPAFLPRKNCGWQCVAVPMKACRCCGRTSLAAVVRAGNNLSLMPTGACRGTMKALYRRLKKTKKSREEIFNEIVEKIHRVTLQEALYCQIVVSYFIQSCEVFDAIA